MLHLAELKKHTAQNEQIIALLTMLTTQPKVVQNTKKDVKKNVRTTKTSVPKLNSSTVRGGGGK